MREVWNRAAGSVRRLRDAVRGPTSSTRLRGPARWLVVAVVAVLGGWLGLLLLGSTTAGVGPVQTRLSLRPALGGNTVVDIPPLGSLTLDTHDVPVRLHVEVLRVDVDGARRLVTGTVPISALEDQATTDVRAGLICLLVRSVLATVAGAVLATLLVLRRPRRAAVAGAVAVIVLVATGASAAATWNPRAIATPRYEGLLTIAPSVVGNAEDIVGNFAKYRVQLAKIVTNVSQLYDVTSTLPGYGPSPDTVRILFVSDLHLSPTAFAVMRSVATQFKTDFVIDAGDITDHGSAPEDRYADQIPTMGQPYVFIRGNHDSLGTERAVERQPNAVVLRGGQATDLEGLRIVGTGDPRFTPDKDTRDAAPAQSVTAAGEALAERLRAEDAAGRPADLVVVHDPAMGRLLDGTAPLVLAGHLHRRAIDELDHGTLMLTQGSTGGAGLRGLEQEKPTPVDLSVLYVDRATGALQAWDDVSVGGLGTSSAQIQRHFPDETAAARAAGAEASTP